MRSGDKTAGARGGSLDLSEFGPEEAAIVAAIADVARKHLEWDGPVSRDLPLVEGFDLDSLRQLTLIMEIENRFRIRFTEDDEACLCSVGDLVDAIRRKLGAPGADAR